jgi:hypothetical protein
MVGLGKARLVDPVTAEQIIGMITWVGICDEFPALFIFNRKYLEY